MLPSLARAPPSFVPLLRWLSLFSVVVVVAAAASLAALAARCLPPLLAPSSPTPRPTLHTHPCPYLPYFYSILPDLSPPLSAL